MLLLSAALLLGMQTAAQLPADVPPVHISTLRGRCVVTIEGRAVNFVRYREVAKGWAATQPEVHFQPQRDTSYRCVDRILTVLKDNDIIKLGFVGNESYAPENPQ